MTNHHSTDGGGAFGPSPSSRALSECRCPAGCGGRPEVEFRLRPVYPEPVRGDRRPPEIAYVPDGVGELVYDSLNGRLGVLMDRIGRLVYLRPPGGGAEWETEASWLESPAPGRAGAS